VKQPLGHRVLLCAILLVGCAQAGIPLPNTPSGLERSDRVVNAEIEAVLQQYVRAINNADPNLLREIWDAGPGASYVNPTQRLRTWEQLEGFWRGFLGDRFSAREFTPDSVTIRHVGGVAWVVFNWEFKATQKNEESYNQHGWETQVYLRSDRGWRIAHAHYSALALRQ
jgi:ketosteroid isomerase-like protein